MIHEWHELALCAGENPLRWDADCADWQSAGSRAAYAASVCAGCLVMAECAADALAHYDIGVVRAGVWLERKDRTVTRHRLAVVAKGKEHK